MNIVLDISEWQEPELLDEILANSPDEVVAVYIKASQGLNYANENIKAYTSICGKHNTAHGYYHFMSNDPPIEQASFFLNHTAKEARSSLRNMIDCEPPYTLYQVGVAKFSTVVKNPIVYASMTYMYNYSSIPFARWIAMYRPYDHGEAETLRIQQYALWQYTDNYLGRGIDSSVLLAPFEKIKKC